MLLVRLVTYLPYALGGFNSISSIVSRVLVFLQLVIHFIINITMLDYICFSFHSIRSTDSLSAPPWHGFLEEGRRRECTLGQGLNNFLKYRKNCRNIRTGTVHKVFYVYFTIFSKSGNQGIDDIHHSVCKLLIIQF